MSLLIIFPLDCDLRPQIVYYCFNHCVLECSIQEIAILRKTKASATVYYFNKKGNKVKIFSNIQIIICDNIIYIYILLRHISMLELQVKRLDS